MSEKTLDKSKCINGSYGWIVVIITMLVGFVPGSNMAKLVSIAPVISVNFGFDEATLALFGESTAFQSPLSKIWLVSYAQ